MKKTEEERKKHFIHLLKIGMGIRFATIQNRVGKELLNKWLSEDDELAKLYNDIKLRSKKKSQKFGSWR